MLHFSENANIRHNFVNLLHDIYTELIVIEASQRIVMLDWLKAQIFYQITKQFQYLHKNCGIAD